MKKKTTSKVSRTDYRRLRALKDEEIDLSDIPVVTPSQIADARVRFDLKDVPEGKTRVTMYLDNAVMRFFKKRAGARGYQTLINDTLAAFIEQRSLEDMIRRVVREELRESKGKSA
jgi:uncharacterized protein (DUF4415 family)